MFIKLRDYLFLESFQALTINFIHQVIMQLFILKVIMVLLPIRLDPQNFAMKYVNFLLVPLHKTIPFYFP